METELKFPKTLAEAIKYFADPEIAHRWMTMMRFPDGVTCPVCGGKKHGFIKTRKTWQCSACKKRFTLKTGTIMEDSPLKIETWLTATWLVTGAKNGISSYEVARALGVSQKTGWFLLHRIREFMSTGSFGKMQGTVEADETYIGGKEENKHANKKLNAGRGTVGKTAVFALLERGKSSRVRAKVVQDTTTGTLQNEIGKNVGKLSSVYTDEAAAYLGLMEDYWHDTVNHKSGEYARGEVHTNGLENWFCLFKRCYKGTWTHISDEHLQRYLNEQEFRFNTRKNKDGERFMIAATNMSGKRLDWKTLTAKG